MTIVIDSREPDELTDLLLEEGADEVKEEHLSTGDFLVRDYIIERKQYGDFIGRLTNSERDIWQQMLAMESAADKNDLIPVLQFEGEWAEALRWSNLTPKEVTAAIGSIMKLGIMTVHTVGSRATAQLLVKLEDESTHDVGSIRDTPSVPEELYPRYLTEGFPGVGPKTAEKILSRYGSFGDIIMQLLTDPGDLQEVNGVGDATVEKMQRYINAELPE